ncbi:PAS domain S-box protein [Oxalobacteraceae bacterium OM1]|nr:PAS domain S-box protein [Oxalobacteraceae bacterium OM1]
MSVDHAILRRPHAGPQVRDQPQRISTKKHCETSTTRHASAPQSCETPSHAGRRQRKRQRMSKSETVRTGVAGHDELEIFRRVFFSSPDYIGFSRLEDGTYIDVNPGFERMLGYRREDVLGRTSFDVGIWPEEDAEQRIAYVAQLKRDGMVKDYPGRLRRADGTVIEVEASANIVEVGGQLLLIAIVRDVTERKRAERELRERETALRQLSETLEQRVAERTAQLQISEARMRSIFESTYQFMGFMTPEGIVLDANRASLRSVDARLEDVVGKPFWEAPWFAQTPELAASMQAAVARVRAGESFRQEVVVPLAAGRRVFDFAMRPVRGPDGEVVGIVPEAVELTARRHAEDALRQAQKMEAVGQLTGGIAHDFNNMLAGVVGNLQLMRVRLQQGQTAPLGQYIDAAESIVDRASGLTHRLLAFSRRQTLAPRAVDVNRLVQSMAELLHRTVGPAVQVEAQLAGDAWNTLCDAHQLESALLNLAINARDAMPHGGRLSIETTNVVLKEAQAAAIDGAVPGPFVAIRVRDDGIGMAPDVAQRAFDPFFTTKPLGQGTGLGLSMVFGFMQQSGGFVAIDSTPAVGTTVTLYLPYHDGPAAEESDTPRGAPLRRPQGAGNVLLVDDDQALRKVLAESLEDAGYSVLQAADGPRGLALLQSSMKIDLMVTDFGLPSGMNGLQLIEAARAFRPAMATLLITGYAERIAARTGQAAVEADIMAKPFSLDAFLARVNGMRPAEAG